MSILGCRRQYSLPTHNIFLIISYRVNLQLAFYSSLTHMGLGICDHLVTLVTSTNLVTNTELKEAVFGLPLLHQVNIKAN